MLIALLLAVGSAFLSTYEDPPVASTVETQAHTPLPSGACAKKSFWHEQGNPSVALDPANS